MRCQGPVGSTERRAATACGVESEAVLKAKPERCRQRLGMTGNRHVIGDQHQRPTLTHPGLDGGDFFVREGGEIGQRREVVGALLMLRVRDHQDVHVGQRGGGKRHIARLHAIPIPLQQTGEGQIASVGCVEVVVRRVDHDARPPALLELWLLDRRCIAGVRDLLSDGGAEGGHETGDGHRGRANQTLPDPPHVVLHPSEILSSGPNRRSRFGLCWMYPTPARNLIAQARPDQSRGGLRSGELCDSFPARCHAATTSLRSSSSAPDRS